MKVLCFDVQDRILKFYKYSLLSRRHVLRKYAAMKIQRWWCHRIRFIRVKLFIDYIYLDANERRAFASTFI
jgi:hypothetical protein